MISGRLPFTGTTTIELSSSILNEPASPLPSSVPAPVRAIVDRCLRKRPEERYQNAGEVRDALETLPAGHITRRRWLAAAGTAAAAAAGVFIWQQRSDGLSDPLDGAEPKQLTNFDGDEISAVISADGKNVIFVSDRDGSFDTWALELPDGTPFSWKKGPLVDISRNLGQDIGFTGTGEIWTTTRDTHVVVAPLLGDTTPRLFLEDREAACLAWSVDGKRIAYISRRSGDPIFVAGGDGTNPIQLTGPEAGIHQHLLVWSRDGKWIYFTRGRLGAPNRFDIWRISPTKGSIPVQLTDHNTDVGYPVPIDERTVLYIARDEQGRGPWLRALDTQTKINRPVRSGTEEYLSLSGTADGRRLVAAIGKSSANLLQAPIMLEGPQVAQDLVTRFEIQTQRAGLRASAGARSSSCPPWTARTGCGGPAYMGSSRLKCGRA
jgi:hypothetical protein